MADALAFDITRTSATSAMVMTVQQEGPCFLCLNHPLQWRHNGRHSVSNHQPQDCLLKCLFRCRSKKTSKLRVTGLCVRNSPHKWLVMRKMFPFDDVIMLCNLGFEKLWFARCYVATWEKVIRCNECGQNDRMKLWIYQIWVKKIPFHSHKCIENAVYKCSIFMSLSVLKVNGPQQ